MADYSAIAELFARYGAAQDLHDREPLLQGVSSEQNFEFHKHRVDRLIVGSPEDCIASIRSFQQALGIDYLILSMRVAAGPSHELELEAIRRFGRDVIPAFKD